MSMSLAMAQAWERKEYTRSPVLRSMAEMSRGVGRPWG